MLDINNLLFQTIVEESDDMIFVIRLPEGLPEYINESGIKGLGYTLEELQEIGIHNIRRAMSADKEFSEHLESLGEAGSATDYAIVRCKDGREIPVEVKAKVININGVDYNLAKLRDISERYESGMLYRDVVENTGEIITRVDTDGNILFVNHMANEIFGLKPKECKGRNAFDFIHPDDRDKTREAFKKWTQGGATHFTYENRQLSLAGKTHYILWNINLHRDFDGKILYFNSVGTNISARVEAEKKLAKLNNELEAIIDERTAELQKSLAFLSSYKHALDANNIVSKSDINGIITYVNDNFVDISGFSRDELIGHKHNINRHPDTGDATFKAMWGAILAKRTWQGIIKNRRKDGRHYWVDINITPILDEKGEISEFVAVRHDITELIDKREEIEKIAYYDSLTGLANRQKLITDIENSIQPTLALLDVDKFSSINDFYGHEIGDRLVNELANIIQENMQTPRCTTYRLHGDEFAVMCCDSDIASFAGAIDFLVDQINNHTFSIDENEILLDLSAGISATAPNELMATADMALKVAKNSQQRTVVYEPSLSTKESYESNITWAKKLKSAIRESRITAYYQPLIDNQTGEWEKYEALIRMIDEEGNIISPFFFLTVAKQSKQYLQLTKIVVEKAFETFAQSDRTFSINLTIDDITDTEMQKYLFSMIQRYNNGHRLVFELVESEGIENYQEVSEFVAKAKALGCRLAIDDFGTGYSNFAYLMQLQADFIKIDGSLIRNIESDANARAIVETIVSFAQNTGIKTVAEFVKDEAVQTIVKEIGIDFSQGFYHSEPLPSPQL